VAGYKGVNHEQKHAVAYQSIFRMMKKEYDFPKVLKIECTRKLFSA